MPEIIDPLRALVQSAQRQGNDMIALTASLHSVASITAGRTSLQEVAYRLFSKAQAHPCECISHEQVTTELRKLGEDMSTHMNTIADSYEAQCKNMGAL